MTLDAEVRALERTALARPDDGAAQVELASALVRMGRSGEALEAFIRAASAEPSDPEVVRALAETTWWSGPRGPGGGSRYVPGPGLRRRPALIAARRLGQGGAGLALGGGIVFARVNEEGGDARLVALALANGRELWSKEEAVAAAAPPLAAGGAVLDAALLEEAGSIVFRVRARDAATGADRWVRTSELPGVQPGATFLACASGTRVAFGIRPHGRNDFEPLVRLLDASSGAPLDAFSHRGLSELALEGDFLYAASLSEPRRILLRTVDGVKVGGLFEGVRTQRVIVVKPGESIIVVSEDALFLPWQRPSLGHAVQIGPLDALVVTPRLVIGSWQRRGTVAFDIETGDRRWSDEPMARMLAGTEDTLYSVTGDGHILRAVDLATGELLWTVDLKGLAPILRGSGVHKLAVAPSRLVGLTKEGVVFILA